MRRFRSLIFVIVPLLFSHCVVDEEPESDHVVENGLRPVYMSYDDLRQISSTSPRALKKPGKIYIQGNYLFINETGEGIHIINNRNPAEPQNVAFISIPGNVDMAVKENVLYADNGVDLVALDISNPLQVKLLKRIENAFPYQSYPTETGVNFECADPTKGVIVRWERATLQNPKCYR